VAYKDCLKVVEILDKITMYKEEIYKQAGVFKAFKEGIKGATNYRKLQGMERYVSKTEDALRRSAKEIGELKSKLKGVEDANEVLKKSNKLWKGVGAAGLGVGVGGIAYGRKNNKDSRKEYNYLIQQ